MRGLFLTDQPLPMKRYIFVMALISLIPSVLLGILVGATGLFEQIGPDIEIYEGPVLGIFFAMVVVSPVVETLFMSLFFFILSFFITSKRKLVVISAIFWAGLHSLLSPGWGLIVWWPFAVFSCAYLTWRNKSWLHAIWVTTCIHALQNLIPSIAAVIMLT
jgi:hypothetical protein